MISLRASSSWNEIWLIASLSLCGWLKSATVCRPDPPPFHMDKKLSSRAERIEHLLPPKAELVDRLSRTVIDNLRGHGYRFVVPPLVESVATLLDGSWDTSLAKRTLQLTDPLGGQPIGIRADITPQIQLIDAIAASNKPSRLCYCGATMYSRPIKPWENREQLQAGAEIFGVPTEAAIVEIAMLAADTLAKAYVNDICLVLGSAGIVNNLLKDCPKELLAVMRAAVAQKDITTINNQPISSKLKRELAQVLSLQGSRSDLAAWEKEIPRTKFNRDALAILRKLSSSLQQAGYETSIDIASQSGYAYHTATTFYLLSGETVVGRGGNYGTAKRPACGFSVNVRKLMECVPAPAQQKPVAAQSRHADSSWRDAIAKLVSKGRVIMIYENAKDIHASCRQRLVKRKGRWILETIKR